MLRRLLALPVVVAAAVALSAAPAGATQAKGAGWDYKGSYDFINKGNEYYPYETNAVNSGGGSFKVCIGTSNTEDNWYVLKEWDPGANADEEVVSWWSGSGDSSGCKVISNLNKYVDGSNGRAEFYVGTQDPAAIHAQYWD
ncbi:hypothetical protein OOZ19_00810 [Saccharopolyspora sp. NFXS83]|uniref:hypothetical protein n=1 Tax=Saccharopolyspora sp. NFXS83 TaxID=2993560 RepID=UPI00224AAE30|nr:hypothetical protein [Saccharopolyspora sp. NFXS83]MCX2728771.1 hypothetical protein [Saccharopolyspora sp. NFXS83]